MNIEQIGIKGQTAITGQTGGPIGAQTGAQTGRRIVSIYLPQFPMERCQKVQERQGNARADRHKNPPHTGRRRCLPVYGP